MNEPEDIFSPLEEPSDQAVVEKKRNKRLEAKEELLERTIAQILSTPEAREWMYEVLSFCKMYASPHVAGDPYSSAFNNGQQNVGQMLLAQIPARTYAEMMIEEEDRRKPEKANARKRKAN